MPDTHILPKTKISDKFRHFYSADLEVCLAELEAADCGKSTAVELYENDLAAWFGLPHALAVSSGAAALTVAMAALGIGPGDEVVLPPTCPLCTIYPIMELGAVPVFCDTARTSFGLDMEDLERVTSPKTKAIIEVPMWGYPTALPTLKAWTTSKDIPLILDLAHSHGSTISGAHLASFGDISCFSTHDRKLLSTGEGGFMLFHDERLAEVARSYTRFGDLSGRTVGVNHKLSPIQAALGRSRLQGLNAHIEIRRRNAEVIRRQIETRFFHELSLEDGFSPNYYAMLLEGPVGIMDNFINYLDFKGIPSDITHQSVI